MKRINLYAVLALTAVAVALLSAFGVVSTDTLAALPCFAAVGMTVNASFSSTAFNPDGLIAHDSDDLVGKVITLAALEDGDPVTLARGTLLGKITVGAVSRAAKDGGNTGGGSLTLDVDTPALAGAQAGVYTVRCITLASNSGVFEVVAPDGTALGSVVVGDTFANQVKFTTADSGTDFALGDGFDITVAAGSGEYNKSLAAALDGSQVPCAILADEAVVTTGGSVQSVGYIEGQFVEQAITFGAGHTADSVREGLRAKRIQLVSAIPA